MSLEVLLPTSILLAPQVPDGVELVRYAPDEPVTARAEDAEVLVVWGNPAAQLRDCARRLHPLRRVQSLAAGSDQVLAAGFGPDVVVTSGRSLHDRPVAEHTLALVLAAARRLHRFTRSDRAPVGDGARRPATGRGARELPHAARCPGAHLGLRPDRRCPRTAPDGPMY